MSYVIEGCSEPSITPDKYIVEFVGNDIVFFNPRPSIIITYLSPHSYIINMNDNISFTTAGHTVTNTFNQQITVSAGTLSTLPHTVCNVPILDAHDLIHVRFNVNIDNFNINDYYQLVIGTMLNGGLKAYIRVYRSKSPFFGTIPSNILDTNINDNVINDVDYTCKKVKLPQIIIKGQANIDGTNLGDMKFTILDKYQYYEQSSIIGTKCGNFYGYPKYLKETIFRKYGKKISLNGVLRGKGCNALEKAQHIYDRDKKLQKKISFYDFYYDNLTLYAMSKYILSYLLYGKFDINFLLGKYNNEFYINLANSRFCHFIDSYTNDKKLKSYNKYFKDCIKK